MMSSSKISLNICFCKKPGDISKLALQKNPFPEVEWISILNQIEAKTKAKFKLPTWFSTKNIYYPNKLNIEQTSSEITANYKD